NPAMGRRRAGAGGASEPLQAIRQSVGIHVRPAPSQRKLSQYVIHAPDRAQSAAVLEMHDHRAGAGRGTAAGDPAWWAPLGPSTRSHNYMDGKPDLESDALRK